MKKYCISALLGTVILVSCHKDIYDPQAVREDFFISNVPAGFDWTTVSSVETDITPQNTYNDKYLYTLEIFGENPISNPQAVCYAKAICKAGQPFRDKVALPEALPWFYIRQTDPTGKKSILMAAVENGKLTASFLPAPAAETQQIAPAAVFLKDKNEDDNETEINDENYNIKQPDTDTPEFDPSRPIVKANRAYILRNNYTGAIQFQGSKATLYLAATWKTTTDIILPPNTELIILPGGKLTASNSFTVTAQSKALVAVAEGGQLGENVQANATLTYTNSGQLINKGQLYLQKFTVNSSGGSLYNSGILTVRENIGFSNSGELINRGTLSAQNIITATSEMKIYNSGTLIVNQNLQSPNSGTFKNEGLARIKNFSLQGTLENRDSLVVENITTEYSSRRSTIQNFSQIVVTGNTNLNRTDLYNYCRFKTAHLSLDNCNLRTTAGTSIECDNLLYQNNTGTLMGTGAFFKVNLTATFRNQSNSICGIGFNWALFQAKTIEWKDWNTATFLGNLEVDCADFEKNEPYNTHYTILWPAHFALDGTQIEIPAGPCTGEGNTNEDQPPYNPQFPFTESLTSPYTWITEDTYPSPSDYDMNDLVIGIDSVARTITEENKVSKMTLYMTLRAVGASRRIGAALLIDGMQTAAITSVTRSSNLVFTDNTFVFDDKGLESGEEVVIPLFDNAHHILGVNNTTTLTNTVPTEQPRATQALQLTVVFAQPVQREIINIDRLNFFAIVQGAGKMRQSEIHLPGFIHSAKSSTPKDVQQNTLDLMWSLLVPGRFQYAREFIDIRKAYPHFQEWVESNKTNQADWYENWNDNYIYK